MHLKSRQSKSSQGLVHIIGGEHNDKHIIFDIKHKQFDKIWDFKKESQQIYGHNIMKYNKNKLLLFDHESKNKTDIYEYDGYKTWKKLNVKGNGYLFDAATGYNN